MRWYLISYIKEGDIVHHDILHEASYSVYHKVKVGYLLHVFVKVNTMVQ